MSSHPQATPLVASRSLLLWRAFIAQGCRFLHLHSFFHVLAVLDNERLTAEEMDERRRQNVAYEYLCHLEEAKR